MDTIELSDMVEPEDCAFFMDNKELYAVSRRLQKLRSYRVHSLPLSPYMCVCVCVSNACQWPSGSEENAFRCLVKNDIC